jgi:hypothetical protein
MNTTKSNVGVHLSLYKYIPAYIHASRVYRTTHKCLNTQTHTYIYTIFEKKKSLVHTSCMCKLYVEIEKWAVGTLSTL